MDGQAHVSPMERAADFAVWLDGAYVETYPRFSLALSEEVGDFLITPHEGGQRSRYLICPGQEDSRLYGSLNNAGVIQFPVMVANSDFTIYELPINVKPLGNERIFADHPSSATYVSDLELFGQLGQLWGRIFAATGRFPQSEILTRTALVDFGHDDKSRLIPVPPYEDWGVTRIDYQEYVLETLLNDVQKHLQRSNPRQSYRALLARLESAWSEVNSK